MLPWRKARGQQTRSSRDLKGTLITRLLETGYWRAYQKRDAAQADLDLCRIVLALQDYRDAHPDYPDDLSALPPGLNLTDPFSGEPYVYRRQGKGFLVYSLGPDMADDQGATHYEAQRGRAGEKRDIVWRCAR